MGAGCFVWSLGVGCFVWILGVGSCGVDSVQYFSHLECSVPCSDARYDARVEQHLCPQCAMPLLARYDLDAARSWKKDSLAAREATMWRYRELMPLFDGEQPITLGEGWTPLVHAKRLGHALGLERLFVKDESLNPTNSFKARGLAAAETGCVRRCGSRARSAPPFAAENACRKLESTCRT